MFPWSKICLRPSQKFYPIIIQPSVWAQEMGKKQVKSSQPVIPLENKVRSLTLTLLSTNQTSWKFQVKSSFTAKSKKVLILFSSSAAFTSIKTKIVFSKLLIVVWKKREKYWLSRWEINVVFHGLQLSKLTSWSCFFWLRTSFQKNCSNGSWSRERKKWLLIKPHSEKWSMRDVWVICLPIPKEKSRNVSPKSNHKNGSKTPSYVFGCI